MPDYKMEFEPLKPTPQRVAAALALKPIASKIYNRSVKAGDLTPFVLHVQKMWRCFLSNLLKTEGQYPPIESKKFAYARNCVPVLVNTKKTEVKLQPCNLTMCPFCWARRVMSVDKKVTTFLEDYAKTHGKDLNNKSLIVTKFSYTEPWDGKLSSFKIKNANLLFRPLSVEKFEGTLLQQSNWVDDQNLVASVSVVGFGSPTFDFSADQPGRVTTALTRFNAPCFELSKAIGTNFAYPSQLLYSKNLIDYKNFLNQSRGQRTLRTSGLFYGQSATTKTTWKSEIEFRISKLEKDLQQLIKLTKENKNGREYLGG